VIYCTGGTASLGEYEGGFALLGIGSKILDGGSLTYIGKGKEHMTMSYEGDLL